MNPWNVLGIGQFASEAEIKTAYRKLAMIWHPDKNKSPEAGAKMAEINVAYEMAMKSRPAVRWTINYEDIPIRDWNDVERAWQKVSDMVREWYEAP